MGSNTVIRGGRVVTMDRHRSTYQSGSVVFQDGRLAFVGPDEAYSVQPDDLVCDARGHLVMPGLINAHTHSVLSLTRGVADELHWNDWIGRILEFDGRASDEDVLLASRLACADLLLNGVTTIADRYGPLDAEATGLVSSGIRAAVCSSITDRSGESGMRSAIEMIEALGTSPQKRVFACLGPHATDTCGPDTMRWVARQAERFGAQIHLHVAQSQEEADLALHRGYPGAVAYMEDCGVIGPHVLATHCIYVNDDDLMRLARSGTRVAHCPSSNIKLEARTAPIRRMRELGIKIGVGNDCASCNNSMDLLSELKIACIVGKLEARDPTYFTASDALAMGTIGGAELLGMAHVTGSLEIGKRADIAVIDLNSPHLMPPHDDASCLVYSGSGRDVRHVFVDGDWVVRDRRLATMDMDDLLDRAKAARARMEA